MRTERFTPEQRLRILQQAEGGLAVTRVCDEHSISRTVFYRWRDRFAREGLPGLADRPPIHKTDALKTPPDTITAIIYTARDHPYLGCREIAKRVSAASISVSFSTVQKVLRANGLGSKEQRWLAREDAYRKGYSKFSKRTLAFIIERNPSFRERHLRTYRAGEHLIAATFALPVGSGLGGPILVAVIDAYSSFAFVGAVDRAREAHLVVAKALAQFAGIGRRGSYLFTGHPALHYRNARLAEVLKTFSVQHVAGSSQPRGFVESLRLWIVAHLREDKKKEDLASIVAAYNTQHAPRGFPNYGLTPAAIFRDGVSTMIKHKPATKRKRP